jgi:hypothetical protein
MQRIKLDLDGIQVNSFVTMLDEDQQQLVAEPRLAWSSVWYHLCIGGTSPGTVGCDGTYSFDQTANNC